MDAFPPDASGFVGGDGQIRFLDWQVILRRSLRLDPSNWQRSWSPGGSLINSTTTLQPRSLYRTPSVKTPSWPWYRQVLIGAVSVGNASPGANVNVPVYAKLGDGSTLAGLQFRAVVTPQSGAPALTQSPQLVVASSVPAPAVQQSFKPDQNAFGWSFNQPIPISFQSRSSNFLGWISFTIPASAVTGQGYVLSFANSDGAPEITTQYDFETRSANVAVNTAAVPASICSDEWKIHFFGSLTNPVAGDLADPDSDALPN